MLCVPELGQFPLGCDNGLHVWVASGSCAVSCGERKAASLQSLQVLQYSKNLRVADAVSLTVRVKFAQVSACE